MPENYGNPTGSRFDWAERSLRALEESDVAAGELEELFRMRSVRNRSKTESETPAWLERLVAASKNSVKGPIMTPIVSTERSIQMLELDHTPTAAAAAAEGIIHDVFPPPYGGGTPDNIKYLGTSAPATPAYHFYPGAGELAAVVPQQVDDRYPRAQEQPDDAKWFFDQDSCSAEHLRDLGASLVSEFLAASAPRRSWKVIRSTVVPVLSAEEDPYLPPPGEEGVEELRKSMQEAKEKGAGVGGPRKLFPDPVQLLTTPVGDWVPEEGRLNVQIGSTLYRRQEMNDNIANDSSSEQDVARCARTSRRTTGAENDAPREAAMNYGGADAQERSCVQPQGPRSRHRFTPNFRGLLRDDSGGCRSREQTSAPTTARTPATASSSATRSNPPPTRLMYADLEVAPLSGHARPLYETTRSVEQARKEREQAALMRARQSSKVGDRGVSSNGGYEQEGLLSGSEEPPPLSAFMSTSYLSAARYSSLPRRPTARAPAEPAPFRTPGRLARKHSRGGRRQQNAFGSLVPGDQPTTSQESGYDIFMRHLNARVESRLSSTAGGGMFAGAGGGGGPKPGGFYHLRQSRSVGPVSIAGALRELRAHEFPSYTKSGR